MNPNRTSHPVGLTGLLILLLLMFFPEQSAQGVLSGLSLCAKRVVPALFPFFVVSNLLLASPAAQWLGLLARPYTHFALGIRDKEAPAALVLSWLGGFAVAASVVSRLYEQGRISRRDAAVLLCCGAGSSPAFVINTVGLLMLGNLQMGICIFAALMVANLICGVIAAWICRKHPSEALQPDPPAADSKAMGLVESVRASVQAMLAVCGFVVFFSGICACIEPLMPESPFIDFGIRSVLEVTGGCLAGAQLVGAPFTCCFALSILSLSVLLQIRALLSKEISLLPLILIRPLHLVLSLVTLRLILRFIPSASCVVSTFSGPVISQSRLAPDAALVLFCLAVAVFGFTSNKRWDIIISRKAPNLSGRKNEV